MGGEQNPKTNIVLKRSFLYYGQNSIKPLIKRRSSHGWLGRTKFRNTLIIQGLEKI